MVFRAGRTRWLSQPLIWVAFVVAVAVGVCLTILPAHGASRDLTPSFLRALLNPAPAPHAGRDFAGTPAVGALFTISEGRLGSHFCTASVIDSPHHDLVITAAHCVDNSIVRKDASRVDIVDGTAFYANGGERIHVRRIRQRAQPE